jgi:hypothetical protein
MELPGDTDARPTTSNVPTQDGMAAQATWRKSSWSTWNGNCVEVARLDGDWVGVRDTRDRGEGPVLLFENGAWREFVNHVKGGDLDLVS